MCRYEPTEEGGRAQRRKGKPEAASHPLILIHTDAQRKREREREREREMEERRRVCLICQNRAVRKREIANDNDSQVCRQELYKFSGVVRKMSSRVQGCMKVACVREDKEPMS